MHAPDNVSVSIGVVLLLSDNFMKVMELVVRIAQLEEDNSRRGVTARRLTAEEKVSKTDTHTRSLRYPYQPTATCDTVECPKRLADCCTRGVRRE